MSRPIEHVLRDWNDAMIVADVDAVMRLCHPDIHLGMHFAEVPLPFIGSSHGTDAARQRTMLMFRTWRFSNSVITIMSNDGATLRTRAAVTATHRWTGFALDVKIRQVVAFEAGLIRSFDSYTDAPRLNAFLHFVGIAPRAPRADEPLRVDHPSDRR